MLVLETACSSFVLASRCSVASEALESDRNRDAHYNQQNEPVHCLMVRQSNDNAKIRRREGCCKQATSLKFRLLSIGFKSARSGDEYNGDLPPIDP